MRRWLGAVPAAECGPGLQAIDCEASLVAPAAAAKRRSSRSDPVVVCSPSCETSGSAGYGAGGDLRMTPYAQRPLVCRASSSAARASSAPTSVTPVAVIASRFACRPRGRRSTAVTCQRSPSPWYTHGPAAQPGIWAIASWTAAHARSRSSLVTGLARAARGARPRKRRSPR